MFPECSRHAQYAFWEHCQKKFKAAKATIETVKSLSEDAAEEFVASFSSA